MGRSMMSTWRCRKAGLAIVGFTLMVAAVLVCLDELTGENAANFLPATTSSSLVDLTIVEEAVKQGAVCLDGTPPGYHLQRGSGSGSNKWLIHLEGGGWCRNSTCSFRKRTHLGSSIEMEKQILFTGILSDTPSENPDFYNWNRVKVRYCDGASFAGDRVTENQENLFFRGQLIWTEVMRDLLAKGMDKANQALLSGCSAGALASFMHCDAFRDLFSKVAKVKCLGDAGFFLDAKDIRGVGYMRSFYTDVVTTQAVQKHLPKSCISNSDTTSCFFPQYLLSHVNTPVFILNPAYDTWQIQNILAPDVADPQEKWLECKKNIQLCTLPQLQKLQEFRTKMLEALRPFKISKSTGMFINSCFVHCQSEKQETWFSPTSPRLNNKTIAEAVGDWFFDRNDTKLIDCPYPCDSTCHDLIFQ